MNKALLINAFHHLPPFSLQPVASPISDILYPILPPSYQPTNRMNLSVTSPLSLQIQLRRRALDQSH